MCSNGADKIIWARRDDISQPDSDCGRSLADLEREIRELSAHLAAATCRWLLLIGEFDQRGGWAQWGIKSCAHWLSWRCSIGPGTAREHVRVARRLPELPLVCAAFARGELTYCKVRAITRIATPQIEEQLLELARHATGAQLEKVVRSARGAIRATTELAQRAHERRHLHWYWEPDGSLSIQGRLTAEDGALLLCALEAAEDQPLEQPDVPAETRRGTMSQRRADALVALARAELASIGVRRAGADPCELVVHVDAATLAADTVQEQSELEAPCISAAQITLAPETVRRLGCDASVATIVERDGRPLAASRRTRAVPPVLRRALRARDRGCRFPGCTHTRFLHAHHIHHWARGGPTNLDNLLQLCSFHHRLVHEGGYTVETSGRRAVRFRRPDGREIPPAPGCPPATGPGLPRQHHRLGLDIKETTCTPLSAGDRLDYDIAVSCLLARRERGP